VTVWLPGLLPIFFHDCEIKSGRGLGTKLSMNLSNAEVARNLNVDSSTVWRTVKLFEETETVI